MSVFGFKEWKLICDLLEQGDQSIILRKGGISEGKKGFQWLHQAFFLFPTYFHEQTGQLRVDPTDEHEMPTPTKEAPEIEIRLFAEIMETWEIDDLDVAKGLEPFHKWTNEVIEERFGYGDNDGISLALLKVYKLKEPWTLENRKAFGGCRSWLGLPREEGLPESWRDTLTPVLEDSEIANIRTSLEKHLHG